MGLIVAFWSPLHGRGTTSNCIASAMQFSYVYNTDVYITHTHYTRSIMENALLSGADDDDILKFSDLGIDSIERAIQTGTLEKDDFKSYCNKINNNLFMLSGSKKTNSELFEESIGKSFGEICSFAKEVNEITFIDIESGFTKDIAKRVIDLADIVVVNLDQTNQLCEEYFNSDMHYFAEDKQIIVIGRYDWESNYNKKIINKKFKQDVFVIPTVTEYLDALNNNRVNEFFKDNFNLEDELFFDELNALNNEIVRRANQLDIKFEKKQHLISKERKIRIPFLSI